MTIERTKADIEATKQFLDRVGEIPSGPLLAALEECEESLWRLRAELTQAEGALALAWGLAKKQRAALEGLVALAEGRLALARLEAKDPNLTFGKVDMARLARGREALKNG